MGTKSKVGVVAGLAAAAAGAYYFYYSKSAAKNRKKAKVWMEKAEKEIMAKVKKLKDVAFNEENYKMIVDSVSEKYKKVKDIGAEELGEFVSVLKGAWKDIQKKAK